MRATPSYNMTHARTSLVVGHSLKAIELGLGEAAVLEAQRPPGSDLVEKGAVEVGHHDPVVVGIRNEESAVLVVDRDLARIQQRQSRRLV